MKDPLIQQVARLLVAHRLVARGDTVVIGVSGGPDSVVLAHVLTQLAPTWGGAAVIAHVNYGLRGKASDTDEALVRAYADRLGWPCRVKRPTDNQRGNFQEWARKLRYRFFIRVARQSGAGAVAVAHHRDDQAETVLMNLIRGAGVTGLSGMAPRRTLTEQIALIRPFLSCSRSEVLRYAERHRLRYRRDATNRSPRYLRNRIRARLLPLLARLNPRAPEHLCAVAEYVREETRDMEAMATAAFARCAHRTGGKQIRLDRARVQHLPAALRWRVLRQAYAMRTGNAHGLAKDHLRHMEQIVAGAGRQYALPGSIGFQRVGNALIFRRVTR